MTHFGAKLIAFVCLLFIQIMVALVYEFSQTDGKYSYSTISAITLAEFIKFCISLFLTFFFAVSIVGTSKKSDSINKLYDRFVLCRDLVREQLSKQFLVHTFVLASLYCINNQIAFILFQYVDVATVLLFKSFTSFQAAIFLWALFGRRIDRVQWSSIVLQVIGLVIVQYDACKKMPILDLNLYIILIISCTITSVCTVWNEYLLKNYSVNLYVQNLVLYLFGTVINLCVYAYFNRYVRGYSKGFFEGYSLLAMTVVFCNSILGIVITAVYKYADAIIKTFSSACATGVLLFLNWSLFDRPTNLTANLGATVIFIASYIYFSVTHIRDGIGSVSNRTEPNRTEINRTEIGSVRNF